MSTPSGEDIIATTILIDTKMAMQALKELDSASLKSAEKIKVLKDIIASLADKMGGNVQAATQKVSDLWNAVGGGKEVLQQATGEAKELGGKLEESGTKGKKAFGELKYGISAVRIAVGILISMLVHQLIQGFQSLVSGAINGLREMETATYNLIGAERALSEQGIGISPKDLDDIIARLQKIDPLLSKIQATELVSRVSRNVAPSVGFNAQQIEQLSRSVATLAIQNKGLGYSFEEVEKQMTDAFLTGKVSQGINRLGIKINDQIVKDEALRLGLVKTEDEFDKLTGKTEAHIKATAMLSIISQKTEQDIKHLPEFLGTADAQFTIFQSRLQDILTNIGVDLAPLLIEGFKALISVLEDVDGWLDKNKEGIGLIVSTTANLLKFFNDTKDGADEATDGFQSFLETVQGGLDTVANFIDFFSVVIPGFSLLSDLIRNLIPNVAQFFASLIINLGHVIPGLGVFTGFLEFKNGIENTTRLKHEIDGLVASLDKLLPFLNLQDKWDEFLNKKNTADTPTAVVADENIVDSGAQEALDKLDDKIKDIADDAQNAKEDLETAFKNKQIDIDIKFNQKTADIGKEYERKAEDAAADLAHKIEDINLDAQQNIEDAKRKAREDEEKAERDLLEKLKELRQKFLMDIEDALHERDARQVLRLIRQYQFDKQAAIDKKKQDDQARADALAADLKNIEIERQRKIESAQIEYARKLEELAIAKARELQELDLWKKREEDDLKVWRERELAEIDKHTQDKLEKLVEGFAQEYGLTDEWQKKIQGLILSYFGQNKAIMDGMYIYMATLAAQMASLAFPMYSQDYSGFGGGGGGTQPSYAFAEGGAIIANKPTVAMFGEAGKELATFTPLDKTGRDVNKVFGDTSGLGGSGGAGGSLTIEMLLSPDLEARVVENALSQTTNVITKITRSK